MKPTELPPLNTEAEVRAFMSNMLYPSAATRILADTALYWIKRCYVLEQRMIDKYAESVEG